jgi:hypothetical protein
MLTGSHHIREEQPKRGIDCAKQSVTEIRFFPRFPWIDVRWTENINVKEPCGEECLLGLSFITCVRNPTSSRRVLRHPHLRMRTTSRDFCRGELARTRSCDRRLPCRAPRRTPRLYKRPGKRQRHPYPRAPPRVRSCRRSLGAEPLADASCPAFCARQQAQFPTAG